MWHTHAGRSLLVSSLIHSMASCLSILLEGSTIGNGDGCLGASAVRAVGLDFLDEVQSLRDLAKDDVLSVQPRGVGRAHKELRSVRVGPRIGHAEGSGPTVGQVEVFVLEGSPVDALSTRSVPVGEVSPLAHEPGNDPVKGRSLVALALFGLGAQLLEVLDRFGNRRSVQAHLQAAGSGSVDGKVEVDRVGDFGGVAAASQKGVEDPAEHVQLLVGGGLGLRLLLRLRLRLRLLNGHRSKGSDGSKQEEK